MSTPGVAVVLAGILFAVARVLMPADAGERLVQGYAAFAHLFVGGVAAAWWLTRSRACLWTAAGLTAVEVAMFFLG